MTDDIRMNAILDRCVSEGRIAQTSRASWAGRYANDPAGTEAVLAALTPTPIGVLGHGRGDAVDETLAAGRALLGVSHAVGEPVQAEHMRPFERPAAEVELTPENVERWTRELFAETRAGAGARQGRVTRDAA
jgi:hypothetical protein